MTGHGNTHAKPHLSKHGDPVTQGSVVLPDEPFEMETERKHEVVTGQGDSNTSPNTEEEGNAITMTVGTFSPGGENHSLSMAYMSDTTKGRRSERRWHNTTENR